MFLHHLDHAEGQTCRDDYATLANTLINTGNNMYHLSIAFFPTDRVPPDFVKVIYVYDDTNITNETSIANEDNTTNKTSIYDDTNISNETSIANEDNTTNKTSVYDDTNIANETSITMETRIANEIWSWSTGHFYFFQPLQVFQFNSLLFGNPDFRSGTVTLTLPSDCANAQIPIMETLTQRVRNISTFDAIA